MGNWKNRIPRGFYRQRSPDYPPRYNLAEPLPDYHDDGVPIWEKKFCTKVGKVPWGKIVDTKKFMSYCHGNIVSWDDSAGEEAFQNAKRRFWAEINGHSCDIALPDPNMYIDEINWDLEIGPGSSVDLEEEYVVPNDEEKDSDEDHKNKKTRSLLYIPPEGWDRNLCEVDNPWPWECNNSNHGADALNDRDGWGEWDDDIHDSKNLENSFNPDSWEYNIAQGDEGGKHTGWGNCGEKLSGLNQWGTNINHAGETDISWKHGHPRVDSIYYNEWGEWTDKSCGWNQQISNNWENQGCQWKGGLVKSRAHNNQGSRYGDRHVWGRKQQEHKNVWPKKSYPRRSNSGWNAWNGGSPKRGNSQNATDFRGRRYQQDGGQRGQYWAVKSNKRVSFGPEQPVI